MPSTFIPTPPFPNVPSLAGVPALQRPIGAATALLPLLIRSLQVQAMPQVLFHAVKAAPVWGVFDALGGQILAPDSIMAFGLKNEYRTSDYPVQDGQFASYNKVTVPSEISLRMVKGSSLQDRVQFEDACETVAASLDVYSIITPEKTYTNMNPLSYTVNRVEKRGAFFIDCDMRFRQINSVESQYSTPQAQAANTSNASTPSAIPPASIGVVQPLSANANLQSIVNSVLAPPGLQLPPL